MMDANEMCGTVLSYGRKFGGEFSEGDPAGWSMITLETLDALEVFRRQMELKGFTSMTIHTRGLEAGLPNTEFFRCFEQLQDKPLYQLSHGVDFGVGPMTGVYVALEHNARVCAVCFVSALNEWRNSLDREINVVTVDY